MTSLAGNSNELDVISGERLSRLQIVVILISFLLNMLDGFDITAMSFTAHSIGEAIQLDPKQLGVIFSVTLAGMMIGAMFLAPLSDIYGRRIILINCVLLIGLSMLGTGFSDSFWQLIMFRLVLGLGVGGMLACLTALTSEYSPLKYRSFSIAIITSGYPLGATLGGYFAAPLLPVYGWESLFITGGVVTLLMLLPVYFLMPESVQFLINKATPKALTQVNIIMLKMGNSPYEKLPLITVKDNQKKSFLSSTVYRLLSSEYRVRTIYLWLTFFFCFVCLYFLISWIPKLVINSGLSESEGLYASAALNGGGVLGILLLGWLASKFSLSNLIGTFLSAAAIVMILLATYLSSLPLLVMFAIIGFLMQGGFVGLYSTAAKIYPTEIRSTGVGWAIGLGRFGAVVGPYVGGVLIANGYSLEINFYIFAVPLLFSGILAYKLNVK